MAAVSFLISSVDVKQLSAQPYVTDPIKAVNYASRTGDASVLNVDTFAIPEYMGSIVESHRSENQKAIVVHIQDAHCDYGCQKRIAEILAYLNSKYGITTVNLEGGKGEYDLSMFGGIRTPERTEKVADLFVRQGILNGAEYYAVNNPGKMKLWGIENEALYKNNLGVYRKFSKEKDTADGYLENISSVINKIKSKIYSPELLSLDIKYAAYKKGNMDLMEYLIFVIGEAGRAGADMRAYPMIAKLLGIVDGGVNLDFKKAGSEREELVAELQGVLSEREMEELVSKVVAFRQERITQKKFYGYLTDKAVSAKIEPEKYRELANYIKYVSAFDELDKIACVLEIEKLSEDVKAALYRNDNEREISRVSSDMEFVRKVLSISLTRDEYSRLVKGGGAPGVKEDLASIKRIALGAGVKEEIAADPAKIQRYLDEMLTFYGYSRERDTAFLDNMKYNQPRGDGHRSGAGGVYSKMAVVITGGFHSGALGELFRGNDISYVSIAPEFRDVEGYKCPYYDILSGGMSKLERSVEAALSTLQVASPFGGIELAETSRRKEILRLTFIAADSLAYNDIAAIRIKDKKDPGYLVFERTTGNEPLVLLEKETPENAKKYGRYVIAEINDLKETLWAISEVGQDRPISIGKHEYVTRYDEVTRAAVDKLRGAGYRQEAEVLLELASSGITLPSGVRKPSMISIVDRLYASHAGGYGIYLRKFADNKKDMLSARALADELIHELLAGLYGYHETGHDFVAKLQESVNKRSGRGLLRGVAMRPVWEMDPEARKRIARDLASDGQSGAVTKEGVSEIVKDQSYLTDDERAGIVDLVLEFDGYYRAEVGKRHKADDDQARYTVTIREIKRFAADFKRVFIAGLISGLSREAAFAGGMKEALENVYLDLENVLGSIPAGMSGGLRKICEAAAADYSDMPYKKQVREKIKRGLAGRTPVLFIKNEDTLGVFETELAEYSAENGVSVHSVQCTPFSDTAQLIGGYMPREKIGVPAAYDAVNRMVNDIPALKEALSRAIGKDISEVTDNDVSGFRELLRDTTVPDGLVVAVAMAHLFPDDWKQKVKFQPGIIPRMIKECRANPGKNFVLNIENVEALPGRVRARLNQFLLDEVLRIPDAEDASDRAMRLPDNLKLIATMGESSLLKDGAFYDRFIRKTVPACDAGAVKQAIGSVSGFDRGDLSGQLAGVGEELKGKNIPCSGMDLLRIAAYAEGRIKRERALTGAEDLAAERASQILFEEALLYFEASVPEDEFLDYAEAVMDAIPGVNESSHFANHYMSYNDAEKSIVINGAPLFINAEIADEIKKNMSTAGEDPQMQDKVIFDVLVGKLNLVVTRQERKILLSIARTMDFGNGVIRLEGVTGAGKTYTQEVLSRLLDFGSAANAKKFYCEPVHPGTKLSRFVGMFKVDEFGDYSLDTETDFLNIVKNGGIASLSEMNTAVKDDYAKFAWWLAQFARGDEEIFLTEYPGYAADGALSPSVKRSDRSLIVIDVNPEDYESRGKMPAEFAALTQKVCVEKMSDGEVRMVAEVFLRHVKDERVRAFIAEHLAFAHCKMQKAVDEECAKGNRQAPVTFRELARAASSIKADATVETAFKSLNEAVSIFYVAAFSEDEQDRIMGEMGLSRVNADDILGRLFFDNNGARSPPVLISSPAEEDPLEDLWSVLAGRGDVRCERVQLSAFTDDFKLFGGYIPIAQKTSISGARGIIDEALKRDARNVLRVYNDMTGRSVFPQDITTGLSSEETLALAAALDALRSGADWRQKLRYEYGVIPRLIYEAKKDPAGNFILVLESLHRIKPSLAVAFNSILQEGVYYDPVNKERVECPANLKFMATSINEASLGISVAEESRWVRVRKHGKDRDKVLEEYALKTLEAAVEGKTIRIATDAIVNTPEFMWQAAFIGYGVRKAYLDEFSLDSHFEFVNVLAGLIREYEGVISPEVLGGLVKKSAYFAYEVSRPPARRSEPLDRKTIHEYFNRKTAVYASAAGQREEDLLVPVDELADVEAAAIGAFQQGRKVVVLEGDPGGGKTDMAIDIANRMGLDSHLYSCHGRVHASDILGGFAQDENGDFVFTGEEDAAGNYPETPFLQMLTHGGVFIFDEGAIGKRSQELISILASIARGEKEFVMNEVPGKGTRRLPVSKDLHIIITTNPPEETAGREQLPLEVYAHAKRVWVPSRLKDESYFGIISRFADNACRNNGIGKGQVFGKHGEESLKSYSRFLLRVQDQINQLLGIVISLEESKDLHLSTLRDIKQAVNSFVELIAQGMTPEQALRQSLRIVFINQFREGRDRNSIHDRLKYIAREGNIVRGLLAAGIDLESVMEDLLSEMDSAYLDEGPMEDPERTRPVRRKKALPPGVDMSDLGKKKRFSGWRDLVTGRDLTPEEKARDAETMQEQDALTAEAEIREVPDRQEFLDKKPDGRTAYMYEEFIPAEGSIRDGAVKELPISLVTSRRIAEEEAQGNGIMYETTIEQALIDRGVPVPYAVDRRKTEPKYISELAMIVRGTLSDVMELATIEIDGVEYLAAGKENGLIELWDLAGNKMRVLVKHSGEINSLAVTEMDGVKYLVSSSVDGSVVFWDIKGGTLKSVTLGSPGLGTAVEQGAAPVQAGSIALVPLLIDNVPYMAVKNNSRVMKAFRFEKDGLRVKNYMGNSNNLNGIFAFTSSAGVQYAVTSSFDNVVLWDLSSGKAVILEGEMEFMPLVTAFERDGRVYVALHGTTKGKSVRVWDVGGKKVRDHSSKLGILAALRPLRIDGSGEYLAAVGMSEENGNIYIVDLKNNRFKYVSGKRGKLWSVGEVRIGDVTYLAVGGKSGSMQLFDLGIEGRLENAEKMIDEEEQQAESLRGEGNEGPVLPEGVTLKDLAKKDEFAVWKDMVYGRETTEEEKDRGTEYMVEREQDVREGVIEEVFTEVGLAVQPDPDEVYMRRGKARTTSGIISVVKERDFDRANAESEITLGNAVLYETTIREALDKMGVVEIPYVLRSLKEGSVSELSKVLKGHVESVSGLITLDVGGTSYLVSGDDDGIIRLWDIVNEKVFTLMGHIGGIRTLSTMEMGGVTYLVSGANNRSGWGSVVLYDIHGRKVRTLWGCDDSGGGSRVVVIDGKPRVVVNEDGESNRIKIWDPSSGGEDLITLKINSYMNVPFAVKMDDGIEYLVIGGGHGSMIFCDLSGKRTKIRDTIVPDDEVKAMTRISVGGKEYIAAGSFLGRVWLMGMDPYDGKVKEIWNGSDDPVEELFTVDHGGKTYLISGCDSMERAVHIYELGEDAGRVKTIGSRAPSSAFRPFFINGELNIAVGGADGFLDILDLSREEKMRRAWAEVDRWEREKYEAGEGTQRPMMPPLLDESDLSKKQDFAPWKDLPFNRQRTREEEAAGDVSFWQETPVRQTQTLKRLGSAEEFDNVVTEPLTCYEYRRPIAKSEIEEGSIVESSMASPEDISMIAAQGHAVMYTETVNDALSESGAVTPWVIDNRKVSSDRINELYKTLKENVKTVYAVVVMEVNGRNCIVSSGSDKRIRIWDPSANTVKVLCGHDGIVNSMTVVKAGGKQYLVSISSDIEANIKIWDIDGRRVRTLQKKLLQGWPGKGVISSVYVNGSPYIACADGNKVSLWDLWKEDGEVITMKASSNRMVTVVKGMEIYGANCLVISDDRACVTLWNMDTGDVTAQLGHRRPIIAVTSMRMGQEELVVSASHDGTVQLYDFKNNRRYSIADLPDRVRSVVTVNVGGEDLLAVASEDDTVRVFKLSASGGKVKNFRMNSAWVDAKFTERGVELLVAGKNGNEICLFDLGAEDRILRAKKDIDAWENARTGTEAAPTGPAMPAGKEEGPAVPEETPSGKPSLPQLVEETDLAKTKDIARWRPIVSGRELTEEEKQEGVGSLTEKRIRTKSGIIFTRGDGIVNILERLLMVLRAWFGKADGTIGYSDAAGPDNLMGGIWSVKKEGFVFDDERNAIERGNAFIYEETIESGLSALGKGVNGLVKRDLGDPDAIGDLYATLRGQKEMVGSLCNMTIRGVPCIVSTDKNAIKIWDIVNGRVMVLMGHTDQVDHVATVTVDGNDRLVSVADGDMRIWDLEKNSVMTVKGAGRGVSNISALNLGGIPCVAASRSDRSVVIREMKDEGAKVMTLRGHAGKVSAVTGVDLDGVTYVASSDGKELKLWDVNGKTVRTFEADRDLPFGYSLVPVTVEGATYLATRGSVMDNAVRLFDIQNGKILLLKGHGASVSALSSLSAADRTYIVSGSGKTENATKIWDMKGGRVKTLTSNSGGVMAVGEISFNGVKCAVTGENPPAVNGSPVIRIWDFTLGDRMGEFYSDVERWEQRKLHGDGSVNVSPAVPGEAGGTAGEQALPKPPSVVLPEEKAISETRFALRASGRVLAIMQPGARERILAKETARREGIERVFSLEGGPGVTVQDLFGGLFPVLEGEKAKGEKKFVYKPGFMTRHMMKDEGKVLLVIHNIDAIPEKVRAAVNNLLLNDFIEIPGRGKLYLKDNVKIMATMSAISQEDFSSAFPNRFLKVNVNAVETREYGVSDFLKYIMQMYSIDRKTAEKIEDLFCIISRLEGQGYIWDAGYDYGFTVKDALMHAQFVSLAMKEKRTAGAAAPSGEEMSRMFISEAMRVYGLRLQRNKKDYDKFTEVFLKTIFKNQAHLVDEIASDVVISGGKISRLSDIPLSPANGAVAPEDIDPRYRLTLVSTMVRTMSGILRGFQVGKAVALTGETGVAKTTMGVALAGLLGLDNYVFSVHQDIRAHDMTGALRMTREGKYKFEISEFVNKLIKGNTVLIVDEANIKPEILWILAGIARGESRFSIEIPGDDPITFDVGRNTYVLFTMNPESYGGGRAVIPGPVREDIMHIWAPSRYPADELKSIVSEFFGGYARPENIKEKEISAGAGERGAPSLSAADAVMLRLSSYINTEYAKITFGQFMEAIDGNGLEAGITSLLAAPTPEEATKNRQYLKDLEKEILASEEVQRRMENIRAIAGGLAGGVAVKFSLFRWWSCTGDGKTINVPLYELVDFKTKDGKGRRSDEAIVGLILHELRHRKYTPTNVEWMEIVNKRMMGGLDAEQREWMDLFIDGKLSVTTPEGAKKAAEFRKFHDFWNLAEDLRIDHMPEIRFESAAGYLDAMNAEFFSNMVTDKAAKIKEALAAQPHVVFRNELLCYGYNGRFSPYFDAYPEEMQKDIKWMAEGDGAALRSATLDENVRIPLENVNSEADLKKAKLAAAANSMAVVLKVLYPVYKKYADRATAAGTRELAPNMKPLFVDLPAEMQSGMHPLDIPGPKPPAGAGAPEDPGRHDNFQDEIKRIGDRLKESIEGEHYNQRLSEVSSSARRLLQGLVQIFRTVEEDDMEESPFGRLMNVVRFLTGSNVPFDEYAETDGKPDLALGITIDSSGSMHSFYSSLKQLNAIFLSCGQQAGNKFRFSITIDHNVPEDIKGFDDKFSYEELNGVQSKVEDKIDGGGNGVHMYAAIRNIIEKYRTAKERNKIEFVFTDAEDVHGDIDQEGRCSARLVRAFEEAERMGIEIIGVGMKDSEKMKAFKKRLIIDPNNVDAIVDAAIIVSKAKAKTGKIPEKMLNEMAGVDYAADTPAASKKAEPGRSAAAANAKTTASDFSKDMKKATDDIRKIGLNIYLIPKNGVDEAGKKQLAIGKGFKKRLDKKYNTEADIRYFDQKFSEESFIKELREVYARATTGENALKMPKVFVHCPTDAHLEAAGKFVAGNEGAERIFVLANDNGMGETTLIDQGKALIIGSILLNDLRMKVDFKLSDEALRDSRLRMLGFFSDQDIIDERVDINSMTAGDIGVMVGRIIRGDILLRITRVDWKSLREWRDAQNAVLMSL
jgi:WD40 repeat protein/MoxR-like ATPase